MNLKSNILRIFSANLITMVSSMFIGFVIPAVLSIEAYSFVKTYTFYISYIGFLHLGFIDGMYIKYGGKDSNDINKSEFKSEHITFFVMQSIITLVFLTIAYFQKDIILFLMGLSIIPMNMGNFHKLFFQATGEFKIFANVSYVHTLTYLLLNVILVIIFNNKNYILYCCTTLIAYTIVFFVLEKKFIRDMKGIKGRFNVKLFNNINIGIYILIGNLSVMLFYAIDRWFIKLLFDINDFGYYSFALSILNIVNILVSSVSITFYNYLSKGEDINKIKKLKNYFIILGSFASLGYFAFSGIISLFLKKYIPSLSIIAISFAAYPYMIIINALYVNLYKARKDERKYVKVVFLMVILSVFYNLVLVLVLKTPQSIAIGTTLAFITWYIYSMKDFKYLKINLKEGFYLIVIFITFIYCSHNFGWFIGGIAYLFILLMLTILIYRDELIEIKKLIVKK